jgi:hypothetical protein
MFPKSRLTPASIVEVPTEMGRIRLRVEVEPELRGRPMRPKDDMKKTVTKISLVNKIGI